MPTKSQTISTIEEALSLGWYIKLEPCPKRMSPNDKDRGREWFLRFTYEVHINSEDLTAKINSDWEGFETPEECTKDLLDKINKLHQN